MSRETIASVLVVLLPLFLTALAALAAWGTRAITRWVKDRRVALALEVLANGAAAIVADLAQHVVANLKDPAKPGTWSEVAAATVRVRAVERVKQLYPQAVALAREALAAPDRIDELLGTVVERAVVDLKAKAPAQLPARLPSRPLAVTLGDEVELGRPTVAPPQPIEPAAYDPTQTLTVDVTEEVREAARRRGEGGNARLVTLLVLFAALGLAALFGLPLLLPH
ncbi:MAG: hypothetical protein Q8S73_37845 [Deltaproteobacteria bacterium]|nr:hypothetical protein [Myxococcales bacterium]MDP3219925.1 hypothetical protein [Deltaproteobacteria bacterium]